VQKWCTAASSTRENASTYYDRKLGVNRGLPICSPDPARALRSPTCVRSGPVDVIVIDSVAPSAPAESGEMGEPQMGLQARLIEPGRLRKLTSNKSAPTRWSCSSPDPHEIGVLFGARDHHRRHGLKF